MKIKHNSQRGSVLIYAMIVSTTTLFVSLTLINLFLPKIKTVRDAVNSTTALYSADSAVEVCIYEARQQPGTQAISRNTLPGSDWYLFENITMSPELSNAFVVVSSLSFTSSMPVDVTPNCGVLGDSNFKFKSVGTFNGVTRSLEVTTK